MILCGESSEFPDTCVLETQRWSIFFMDEFYLCTGIHTTGYFGVLWHSIKSNSPKQNWNDQWKAGLPASKPQCYLQTPAHKNETAIEL